LPIGDDSIATTATRFSTRDRHQVNEAGGSGAGATTFPKFGTLLSRFVVPLGFYFVAFCVLTWPRITQFSTHFFCDAGDGLQNVWNMWWIKKAVTELHQSPWHTTWLHYPFGISLHGHTLNPFNGLLGIVLQQFMTLRQAHNTLIVLSFSAGGLTAFWLALRVSGSYGGSLLAGYVFTFSQFHFAHAQGHMNLVSLQWLPLFLLFALNLVDRPTVPAATAAALGLFGVYLCDYYYFLYGVSASAILVMWTAWQRKDPWFWTREAYRRPVAAFLLVSAATTGVLLIGLAWSNWNDPFVGSHPADMFSLDLLALVIPGGHWRFAPVTAGYWSRLKVNIHESSVYVGYGVLFLLVCAWRGRRAVPGLSYWFIVLAFFGVMALGPVLHLWGRAVPFLPLPYSLLEVAIPWFRLSGVPVRMVVMVTLAAAVIAAVGVRLLWAVETRRWVLVPLLILIGVEYVPWPIPAIAPPNTDFVEVLGNPSGHGAYIEASAEPLRGGTALYFQTQHEQPMAFGYTSRTSQSVERKEAELRRLAGTGQWQTLACQYGIRWLLTDTERSLPVPTKPVVLWTQEREKKARLYEIGALCRG